MDVIGLGGDLRASIARSSAARSAIGIVGTFGTTSVCVMACSHGAAYQPFSHCFSAEAVTRVATCAWGFGSGAYSAKLLNATRQRFGDVIRTGRAVYYPDGLEFLVLH
jgi:hypothetical protein